MIIKLWVNNKSLVDFVNGLSPITGTTRESNGFHNTEIFVDTKEYTIMEGLVQNDYLMVFKKKIVV